MITSTRNPRIQQTRLLQNDAGERRSRGLFVIEGVRLAEEALAAGWTARWALTGEQLSERGRAAAAAFAAAGAQVEPASEAALRAASDTENPQGLIVVLERPPAALPPALDFVLIADELRDPGNLGTILRSAAAAGAQAVIAAPGSADLYAPKVLRAGMGAHFRLAALPLGWEEIGGLLSRHGLAAFLACAGEGLSYTQADFTRPAALIIGGEAAGAGAQARALLPQPVHIPMPGGGESLNAAAAAAILLFEAARQRAARLHGTGK